MKRLNLFILVLLAAAIPLTIYLAFQRQDIRQRAAPEGVTLYLIPNVQKVTPGEPFSIDIDVKTGTTSVTSVQIGLTYPTEKLEIEMIDPTNSAFETQTEQFSGAGLISIGRHASAPVSGEKHIATIRFTVLEEVNASEVTLTPGSPIFRSANDKDIIASSQLSDARPKPPSQTIPSFWDPALFFSNLLSFFKNLRFF